MRYNKRAWKKQAWSFLAFDGCPPSKRLKRERKRYLRKLYDHILVGFDLDLLRDTCKKFVCEGDLLEPVVSAAEYNWKMLK